MVPTCGYEVVVGLGCGSGSIVGRVRGCEMAVDSTCGYRQAVAFGRGVSGPRARRDRPPASVSAGLGTRVGVHLGGSEPSPHAQEVLDAVARIPPGKVMTYGDVAEYVGAGTGRTVGAALSRYADDDLPWHRVIRSTGEPNPANPTEALRRLIADRTPLRPAGDRVDLPFARWNGTPSS